MGERYVGVKHTQVGGQALVEMELRSATRDAHASNAAFGS